MTNHYIPFSVVEPSSFVSKDFFLDTARLSVCGAIIFIHTMGWAFILWFNVIQTKLVPQVVEQKIKEEAAKTAAIEENQIKAVPPAAIPDSKKFVPPPPAPKAKKQQEQPSANAIDPENTDEKYYNDLGKRDQHNKHLRSGKNANGNDDDEEYQEEGGNRGAVVRKQPHQSPHQKNADHVAVPIGESPQKNTSNARASSRGRSSEPAAFQDDDAEEGPLPEAVQRQLHAILQKAVKEAIQAEKEKSKSPERTSDSRKASPSRPDITSNSNTNQKQQITPRRGEPGHLQQQQQQQQRQSSQPRQETPSRRLDNTTTNTTTNTNKNNNTRIENEPYNDEDDDGNSVRLSHTAIMRGWTPNPPQLTGTTPSRPRGSNNYDETPRIPPYSYQPLASSGSQNQYRDPSVGGANNTFNSHQQRPPLAPGGGINNNFQQQQQNTNQRPGAASRANSSVPANSSRARSSTPSRCNDIVSARDNPADLDVQPRYRPGDVIERNGAFAEYDFGFGGALGPVVRPGERVTIAAVQVQKGAPKTSPWLYFARDGDSIKGLNQRDTEAYFDLVKK